MDDAALSMSASYDGLEARDVARSLPSAMHAGSAASLTRPKVRATFNQSPALYCAALTCPRGLLPHPAHLAPVLLPEFTRAL